jgi:hypothetical protein
LADEPPDFRVVVAEGVVVQPGALVFVLPGEAQRLLNARLNLTLRACLNLAPRAVLARPSQLAFIVGYFQWSANKVAEAVKPVVT